MIPVLLDYKGAFLGGLCALVLAAVAMPVPSTAQDNPPTPFLADFDGGDGSNNYGGGLGGFAVFGDWQWAFDYTTPGPSGQPGDFAMRGTIAALQMDAASTYFGVYMHLRSDFSGVDLTGFETLSFDIKAGTGTAHTDYVVRLEDTDGAEEWNNPSVQIPPLTTDFQTVSVPLSSFTGGGQPTDLTIVKQIVFANYNNEPVGSGTVEVDLIIDNVQITATPLVPPLTEFFVTFDDNDRHNSEGGDTRIDAGYGGPGFTLATDQITTGLVSVGAGDLAYEATASIANSGDSFSFAAWYTKTDPTEGAGRDFSLFSMLEIEAAVLPANNLTWRLRLEDNTGDVDNFDHYDFTPPLSTSMQTYQIPVSAFLDGNNGTKIVDITNVWAIAVAALGGPSSQTPTLNVGLQVSRITLVTLTGVRQTLWNAYE